MSLFATTRRFPQVALRSTHLPSSKAEPIKRIAFGGRLVLQGKSAAFPAKLAQPSMASAKVRPFSSLAHQLSKLNISSEEPPTLTAKQISNVCAQKLQSQLAQVKGILDQIDFEINEKEMELAVIHRRYYAMYQGAVTSTSSTDGADSLNPGAFESKMLTLCKNTEGSLKETIAALNLLFKELHTFNVQSHFSVPSVQLWGTDDLPAIFSGLAKLIQTHAHELAVEDMDVIHAHLAALSTRAQACKGAIETQRAALETIEQKAADLIHQIYLRFGDSWPLPHFRKRTPPPQ